MFRYAPLDSRDVMIKKNVLLNVLRMMSYYRAMKLVLGLIIRSVKTRILLVQGTYVSNRSEMLLKTLHANFLHNIWTYTGSVFGSIGAKQPSSHGLKVFFILIFILLCFSFQNIASSEKSDCKYESKGNARSYWSHEIYTGIRVVGDSEGYRKWDTVRHPGSCYITSLSEINDPSSRILGYKQAMEEWIKLVYFQMLTRGSSSPDVVPERWNSAEVLEYRNKITSLVGKDFSSYSDFEKWWDENQDYLYWSDTKNLLFVDEDSKRDKKPVTELYPTQDISAEEYWYQEGMNWLSDVKDDGDNMRGWAWGGYHGYKFRISKEALDDRSSKENGYRRALAKNIQFLASLPDLDTHDTSIRKGFQSLRKITDEDFDNINSWIIWWEDNKDNLKLSKDGNKLVVSNH